MNPPSRQSRRTFLGHGLMLAAVALDGFSQPLLAQTAPPLRYGRLAQPVVVPLADLSTLARARPFIADAVTLSSAAEPNRPIRISGMVARIPGAENDNRPDRFSAVCVLCPHEHCDVDFVRDPSRLPAEVVAEIGHPVKEPVYMCPCHNSTFKIDDGGRLAGPAPRGLYRFRVTSVTAAALEIGEVEEDMLIFT